MAEVLTAIESVRAHDSPSTTDSELKVMASSSEAREDGLTKSGTESRGQPKPEIISHPKSLASPEDVLQVLRSVHVARPND